MLGSLRFFLACLVVQSHMPGDHQPVNFGITAVVIFYFISGYLMNLSYRRFDSPLHFYADRVARLYPAYLFLLLVTISGRYMIGHLPSDFSVSDLLENLVIIPINYYLDPRYAGINISWSLAAEMQFYLMVPLIFALRRWVLVVLTICVCLAHIVSFFVSASMADLGFEVVSSPYWSWASAWLSYRLPFLIFTVFLMGFLAADKDGDSRLGLIATWALYALFFFLLSTTGASRNAAVNEVALGALVALPLTLAVLQVRAGMLSNLDRVLGRLAYPLFLGHIICRLVAAQIGEMFGWPLLAVVASIWISSLLFAYFTWWLVERNVHEWRYKLRGFGQVQPAT